MDPPRRAEEGPRQPKIGPRWAQQGAQDPLGGPDPPLDLIKASRGHLQPILGPSWAISGRLPLCTYACARARGARPRRRAARKSNPARYSWSSLGSIVLRCWPIFGPSWPTLGFTWPFQAHLLTNMESKLSSSSPQGRNKTSKQPLCKLSQGSLPEEISQKHLICFRFAQVFAIPPFNHV